MGLSKACNTLYQELYTSKEHDEDTTFHACDKELNVLINGLEHLGFTCNKMVWKQQHELSQDNCYFLVLWHK